MSPEKHYLGTLCKRGHDWKETGKSLRFKRTKGSGNCIKCAKIMSEKRRRINGIKPREVGYSKIEAQCFLCDKKFKTVAWNRQAARLKKGQPVYCSKSCSNSARAVKVEIKCDCCGIKFKRIPSQAQSDHLFCSNLCRTNFFSGKNAPAYIHGKSGTTEYQSRWRKTDKGRLADRRWKKSHKKRLADRKQYQRKIRFEEEIVLANSLPKVQRQSLLDAINGFVELKIAHLDVINEYRKRRKEA